MADKRGRSARGIQRRNALLRTAWEVFSEQGYQSASMDMVVAKAGGSKQTLYSYFKSKEDLLRAVLEARREELSKRIYHSFEVPDDFVASLWNFGIELIDVVANSELIELYRLTIAETKALMLRDWIYELGFAGNWRVMAEYLEKHIASELLFPDGGWTAAIHLRGVLEGDLMMRRLCGVTTGLSRREIALIVRSGLEAFFRIYAPDTIEHLRQHADKCIQQIEESEDNQTQDATSQPS